MWELIQIQKCLKQRYVFCYPSNHNKFQISHQRTDLIKQKSQKNVLKANTNFRFFRCDIASNINMHHKLKWFKNNVVKQKHYSIGLLFPHIYGRLTPVLCNQVTKGSLAFSFVGATSLKDVTTIQGKGIMDRTRSHSSIT